MTALAPIRFERPGVLRIATLPPLSIYVHIPWCVRKCPYCDFNSHEKTESLPEREYVDALIGDLEVLLPSVWGRRVASVFIGGGTPSLFSPESIARLLSDLRARVPLEPGAEITLEANPGTAEATRFRGYADAGVNRLSIGVQSFDDAKLAALGRIHTADEARRALGYAFDCFDNVNVDVMYGLPGQTLAEARADLIEAARRGAAQVSAYQLAIEPNTGFHRRRPVMPEHDLCADMQRMAEDILGAAGYEHYETSAFARPGLRCRHNLNYWRFGDYLGLGAGAHGKLSFADRITRHARIKTPRGYLSGARQGSTLAEERTVGAQELPLEFMLNALRLTEGFDEALFTLRTGLPGSAIEVPLARALEQGLIERTGGCLRPSARGRLFLNDLLGLFLGKD